MPRPDCLPGQLARWPAECPGCGNIPIKVVMQKFIPQTIVVGNYHAG